jgi:Spy/CpxP family protein refolding chaperone
MCPDVSNRNVRSVVWLTLFLLWSSGTVLAQPFPPPHGGHRGGGPLGLPLHELQLTAEQQTQVAAIEESYQQERMGKMEALRSAHQELLKAVTAETFDESAIRAASSRVAAAEADAAVLQGSIFAQIRPLLTPAQLESLARFVENGPSRPSRPRSTPAS